MATETGYLNETVEAVFSGLATTRFAEKIGLFALEELCATQYRPGMSIDELGAAVVKAAG